jgi:hypothetical protein
LHRITHEVVGHASGQINAGVGTPKETLKVMPRPLKKEADLVGLYYLYNQNSRVGSSGRLEETDWNLMIVTSVMD